MSRAAAVVVDFNRERPGHAWPAVALLLAGLAVSGAGAYQWERGTARVNGWEDRVAALHRSGRNGGKADGVTARPEEVRAANQLISSLNVPWQDLFRDIEAAADPAVALLAVQPDARTRALRLTGTARDFGAVLAYVRRLEQTPALADVHVARHELKGREPQNAIEFVVQATWVQPK